MLEFSKAPAKVRNSKWVLGLGLVLTGAIPASAQETVVATDDGGLAGGQPHLTRGENYEFPESAVKGTPRDRSVAFGDSVQFAYSGLILTATKNYESHLYRRWQQCPFSGIRAPTAFW